VNAVMEYVLNSLGWSLVGFLVGWLAASLRRDVSVIKEALVDHDQEQEPPVVVVHHPHSATATATRILGIVVALLAVITVGQGVVSARRDAGITECQARYNHQFARAMGVRVNLADRDRRALQTMLVTIYRKRDAPPQERLAAFQEWVDTVERTERERKDHPLPELPKDRCE